MHEVVSLCRQLHEHQICVSIRLFLSIRTNLKRNNFIVCCSFGVSLRIKRHRSYSSGESERIDELNQCRCVSGRTHCSSYDCDSYRRGSWCPWSAWTPCTAECGQQRKSRIKMCSCPAPSPGTQLGCEDYTIERQNKLLKEEEKECHIYPLCPRDGGYSEWTEWSQCTVQAYPW